ncbi:hypothetical protein JZ751_019878 [Albula glossodonta]|uniref:Uncharacterized protein n=1 Tax=Albula glossodonta TaxID=121402 RepID=A0A8T2NM74_9TELE|nr:hypothetical protein JZ751_019878 [Albula glossodonta]
MPAHVKPGPGQKKEDRSYLQKARPMPSEVPGAHVDPTFRLLMEEKEQALLALQETVERRTGCVSSPEKSIAEYVCPAGDSRGSGGREMRKADRRE